MTDFLGELLTNMRVLVPLTLLIVFGGLDLVARWRGKK